VAYITDGVWWCTNLPEREDGKNTIDELRHMEDAARPIPDWAKSIAIDNINYFPPCGHAMFVQNVNAILDAITNRRRVEGFFHCFVVAEDALRKSKVIMNRCSKDTSSGDYATILMERMQHWTSINSQARNAPSNTSRERLDYYDWDEQAKRTMARIGKSPDDQVVNRIKDTWLCAPKAFRFIEKIGDEIGIDLHGLDAFDKSTYKQSIVDSLRKVEAAALIAFDSKDPVSYFLLSLLKTKLVEYVQNGILQKLFVKGKEDVGHL